MTTKPEDPTSCPSQVSEIWQATVKPVLDACHVKGIL